MDPLEDFLEVRCVCGHVLGMFSYTDDCGSVIILCPACGKGMEINNQAIMEVVENPEDYEPNDHIVASEV